MPLRNPYVTDGLDEATPWTSPGRIPAYLAWAGKGFLRCWLQTRRIPLLFQGLPAVVLAAVLAMLFISSDQPVSLETIDGYLRRAEHATAAEEFTEAEFYFRKLEQLAPDDRNVIEQHARLHARQGNYFDAFRMMESLVRDDDQTNDPRIHRWLAEMALQEDVGLQNPLDYAKEHLVAVLDDEPEDRRAHYFFMRLHLMKGDIPSAIEHLERIQSRPAELQLLLASLYQQRDPPDAVRTEHNAKSAAELLRKEIQETQTSDVSTYHQLAAAYILLKDFDRAIQTLRQARTKFDDEATRRQMSTAYVAWSDHVRQQRPDDVGEQMQLLEKALQLAPNEPKALQRMLEIASAEGPGAEAAEARLRKALVDGAAPAAIHFSLGALAAKRGDMDAAMRHFRQSEQLNPGTAVTLNNIAYIMAQSPDADLQQALTMANQAVEMAPQAAPFRDTRGQILTRLERWSEAISDLEYANSKMDDLSSRVAINRSLAVAYRGLGDEQTAEAYQDKFEELRARLIEEQKDRPASVVAPDLGTTEDEASAAGADEAST